MKSILLFLTTLFFICTTAQSDELFPLKINGQFGYVNADLNIVIPPVFDAAYPFNEIGNAKVKVGIKGLKRDNRDLAIFYEAVIDKKGYYVIPPYYVEIREVKFNGKYYYHAIRNYEKASSRPNMPDNVYGLDYLFDEKGSLILKEEKFNLIFSKKERFIEIKNGKGYGATVLNFELDTILPFGAERTWYSEHNNLISADYIGGGKRRYTDYSGKEIFDLDYGQIGYLNENRFMVINGDYWQIIDRSANAITSRIKKDSLSYFSKINWNFKQYSFSNGYMGIRDVKKDKVGYINKKEKLVIDYIFDFVKPFHRSKKAIVQRDYLFGVINKKGKTIVPIKFKKLEWLGNKSLRVEEDKKFGVINTKGEEIIPVKYKYIRHYPKTGLLQASLENGYRLFYENGVIFQDSIEFLSNPENEKRLVIRMDGVRGMVNDKGKTIHPFKFSNIFHCGNGNYLFQENESIEIKNTKWKTIYSKKLKEKGTGCHCLFENNNIIIYQQLPNKRTNDLYAVLNLEHLDIYERDDLVFNKDSLIFFVKGDTVFEKGRGFRICNNVIPEARKDWSVSTRSINVDSAFQTSYLSNLILVGKGTAHLKYQDKSIAYFDSLRIISNELYVNEGDEMFYSKMDNMGKFLHGVGDTIAFFNDDGDGHTHSYYMQNKEFEAMGGYTFNNTYSVAIDYQGEWELENGVIVLNLKGMGFMASQITDKYVYKNEINTILKYKILSFNENKIETVLIERNDGPINK